MRGKSEALEKLEAIEALEVIEALEGMEALEAIEDMEDVRKLPYSLLRPCLPSPSTSSKAANSSGDRRTFLYNRMKMAKTELISYCGLFCGACSFRVACQDKEEKHLRAMPEKYDKYKNEPLGVPCGGCKPDPDSCGDCGIRTCAKGRALSHCGLCPDFPCQRITDFNNDGVPHHGEAIANLRAIKEMGEEAWAYEQEKRWTCVCGARLSWYVPECPKCGNAAAGL